MTFLHVRVNGNFFVFAGDGDIYLQMSSSTCLYNQFFMEKFFFDGVRKNSLLKYGANPKSLFSHNDFKIKFDVFAGDGEWEGDHHG